MDVYTNESFPCPNCHSRLRRVLLNKGKAASGDCRSECEGCKRFWGWVSPATVASLRTEKSPAGGAAGQPPAISAKPGATPAQACATSREPAPNAGELAGITPPEVWVYVSRKLDLEWLPNAPLWAAPVVRFGATWFYRLTPAVLAWLDAAGRQIEDAVLAGKVGIDQLDAYLAVMAEVWRFADRVFDPAATRAVPAKLPEVPAVPAG
jgi:hypothetical protein